MHSGWICLEWGRCCACYLIPAPYITMCDFLTGFHQNWGRVGVSSTAVYINTLVLKAAHVILGVEMFSNYQRRHSHEKKLEPVSLIGFRIGLGGMESTTPTNSAQTKHWCSKAFLCKFYLCSFFIQIRFLLTKPFFANSSYVLSLFRSDSC